MNNVVYRRFRVAASGAAALLLVTLGAPQLARAASASAASPGSPAAGGRLAPRSSGTDASCPAATPAAADGATVSAPQLARAIPGSASATVVWCPPPTGASQVTSYTVTASPGGQQVTAAVPNDWAIIDGLTDGTSYTFTVTANTAAASGTQAATTTAATPEAIAPPRDVLKGAPQTIGYDQYSMLIGGQRVYITAGEFDPWRTPSPSL